MMGHRIIGKFQNDDPNLENLNKILRYKIVCTSICLATYMEAPLNVVYPRE